MKFYTLWIKNEFKSFGKSSYVEKGLSLLNGQCISIGNNVHIGKNAVITAWDKYQEQIFHPEIFIDEHTSIGEYCHISAINKIYIGKNVLTGRWLTVVDNAHGVSKIDILNIPPIHRPLYSKGIVRIGDNVWLGDKVTILAGVVIGNNAIIGANSVVTKNIPANAIAGGIPAKIIKQVYS